MPATCTHIDAIECLQVFLKTHIDGKILPETRSHLFKPDTQLSLDRVACA